MAQLISALPVIIVIAVMGVDIHTIVSRGRLEYHGIKPLPWRMGQRIKKALLTAVANHVMRWIYRR